MDKLRINNIPNVRTTRASRPLLLQLLCPVLVLAAEPGQQQGPLLSQPGAAWAEGLGLDRDVAAPTVWMIALLPVRR